MVYTVGNNYDNEIATVEGRPLNITQLFIQFAYQANRNNRQEFIDQPFRIDFSFLKL
jgi:hypothetical protein